MSACFCSGPAPGETLCPCQLRDVKRLGDIRESVVVNFQQGWKCPVCGKGNAPFQRVCGNALCGVNTNEVTA